MSRVRPFRHLLALLAIVTASGGVAAPSAAQSLFAGRGLGYAMEPLDGRARGLGGVGLGLPEPSLSLVNPASVAGLPAPTIHVTLQPDQFTSTYAGTEATVSTVRFPLIHVALPFRRFTGSIAYSSFLDRNWAVEQDTVVAIGGTLAGVRDRFASRGGVARLRLGGAYALDRRLAIGGSVDVYTGSVQDTLSRFFRDSDLQPAVRGTSLSFRGLGYGAGARWVPNEAVGLEAAVSAGGQLDVRSTNPEVPERTYDLPVTFSAGASGRIAPELLVALSGRWSGWSSVDGAPLVGEARDTWMLGGGIEWEALRVADRVVPLRLGYRHSALPFRWAGTGTAGAWADERAFTGGLGLRLAGGAAIVDAGVERGQRGGDDAGIREQFWRMAFSLTLLGR
jgi:hypothetical protein